MKKKKISGSFGRGQRGGGRALTFKIGGGIPRQREGMGKGMASKERVKKKRKKYHTHEKKQKAFGKQIRKMSRLMMMMGARIAKEEGDFRCARIRAPLLQVCLGSVAHRHTATIFLLSRI